jgi:hypothetical protein
MNVAQQIVGVNERLGNFAVPQMQGTTRYIYDALDGVAAVNSGYNFFQGVSNRVYPLSNINQNRFEAGESLAVQGIQLFTIATYSSATQSAATAVLGGFPTTAVVNLFIGNQRVLKNIELGVYSLSNLGKSIVNTASAGQGGVGIFLETPIVIPPQVEFFVTAQISASIAAANKVFCALWGTGTLLNPKENY